MAVDGLFCGFDHCRVAAESQVVVGTEEIQDGFASRDCNLRALWARDDSFPFFVKTRCADVFKFLLKLRLKGIEHVFCDFKRGGEVPEEFAKEEYDS